MPGRRGLSYAGQVSPSAPDDDGMSVLQKHLANVKRKAATSLASLPPELTPEEQDRLIDAGFAREGLNAARKKYTKILSGETDQQITSEFYQPFPNIREPETPQENLSFQSLMSGHPILGHQTTTVDPGETDMWKGMATYRRVKGTATPELHQQNIQSNAPPPDPAFRQSLMQSDIYRQLSAQPNPGQFETNMLQNPQQLDEATRRALLRNLQQSTATRQPPMVTTPQVR